MIDIERGVFDFRPLREADVSTLRAWLLRPHVAQWWGPAESIDELRSAYVDEASAPDATQAWIAHLDGAPIGFIQCYVAMGAGDGWWEDETDPGTRGIDQFIADTNLLNRGVGRRMIRAFVSRIFADPAVTLVQTDPDPDNVRAIRCYAAAGFRAVDRVDTPDGPALLMRCTRESLAQSSLHGGTA